MESVELTTLLLYHGQLFILLRNQRTVVIIYIYIESYKF